MHNSFSFLLGDGPPLTPILPQCDSVDTLNFKEDARRKVRSMWHNQVILGEHSGLSRDTLRSVSGKLAQATTFDDVLAAIGLTESA